MDASPTSSPAPLPFSWWPRGRSTGIAQAAFLVWGFCYYRLSEEWQHRLTLGDAVFATTGLFFIVTAIRYGYLKWTGNLLVRQGRPLWCNPVLCGLVALLIIGIMRIPFRNHSAVNPKDPELANAAPAAAANGESEDLLPPIYVGVDISDNGRQVIDINPVERNIPLSAKAFVIPSVELDYAVYKQCEAFTQSEEGKYPTGGYPKIGMYGGQYITQFVATKSFHKWTLDLRYKTRDSVELTVRAGDFVLMHDIDIKVLQFSAIELHQLEPLLQQYLVWRERAKNSGVPSGASKEIGQCGQNTVRFNSSGDLQIGIYTFSDDLADQILDILSNGGKALHAQVMAKVAKLSAGISIENSKRALEHREAEARKADAQHQLDAAIGK